MNTFGNDLLWCCEFQRPAQQVNQLQLVISPLDPDVGHKNDLTRLRRSLGPAGPPPPRKVWFRNLVNCVMITSDEGLGALDAELAPCRPAAKIIPLRGIACYRCIIGRIAEGLHDDVYMMMVPPSPP